VAGRASKTGLLLRSPENTIDEPSCCGRECALVQGSSRQALMRTRISLRGGGTDMSENDVISNQKQILRNQKEILANQKQIKANQDTIKKNQATILKNQGTLNTILKNQKQILALLNK
jgi:hypothetical protein